MSWIGYVVIGIAVIGIAVIGGTALLRGKIKEIAERASRSSPTP